MNYKPCCQETAIAQAVRTGQWSESLRTHLLQCESCRSVQQAARWMQGLAAPAQEEAESRTDLQDALPDPRILWLRAHLGERQAAAERAHRISQWVEIGCIAAVCAALGLWLVWSWNEIGEEVAVGLRWAAFDAWRTLSAGLAAYGPANAPVLFSSALALISLVAIAVAYPLFARD